MLVARKLAFSFLVYRHKVENNTKPLIRERYYDVKSIVL
jgi:hypothetical protein